VKAEFTKAVALRSEIQRGVVQWKTPEDVRERYPTVSFIGGNRAVFNMKGKKYRLDTTIAFNTGIVQINRAGTHAEYGSWIF